MSLAVIMTPTNGKAASSVTIWPVNPVMAHDAPATALWLENNDHHDVLLQIRVFRWTQGADGDQFDDQTDIIASPPMATVSPGSRQLIRLMRGTKTPSAREEAYRVIIDEIPPPDSRPHSATGAPQIGIQLRYSVPLFVEASAGSPDQESSAEMASQTMQHLLSARVVTRGGKAFLTVRNSGSVHVRLTKVSLGGAVITNGLLGYVLPHSEMAWPLATGRLNGPLQAALNGAATTETIPLSQ
ncbi:fimbrial biogenesis chaperone [Asaia spathodeae]|uniref:Molecular chaperone n=1 Tax=Asaia spathodeae TaxID=657016 RepID=A0ABX2P3U1_9PROT|nr:molecular chaperone [Asaia spathodeae]GBR22243.1 P pilus assembly protein PapD [Asaia spathodeae NBRC 105894]